MGRNVPQLSQEETDMCVELFRQSPLYNNNRYNIKNCAKSIMNHVIDMRQPEQEQKQENTRL